MAKAALSASSALQTKPAWRTRLAIASGRLCSASPSHRTAGTFVIAPIYDAVFPFYGGLGLVVRDDAPLWVDPSGQAVGATP